MPSTVLEHSVSPLQNVPFYFVNKANADCESREHSHPLCRVIECLRCFDSSVHKKKEWVHLSNISPDSFNLWLLKCQYVLSNTKKKNSVKWEWIWTRACSIEFQVVYLNCLAKLGMLNVLNIMWTMEPSNGEGIFVIYNSTVTVEHIRVHRLFMVPSRVNSMPIWHTQAVTMQARVKIILCYPQQKFNRN